MKKILLLFLAVSTATLYSQKITAPEPEFEGEIVYVSPDNQNVDLEQLTVSVRKGQSVGRLLTGIGKVKARVVAKGKTSSTLIKKSDVQYFIYNHGSNRKNPKKIIQLLQFEQKRKSREHLVASVSNVTGQSDSRVLNIIQFKAKKYGETSYLVMVKNLKKGEYAFFVGEEDTLDGNFFTITE